ncbi:PKD domain-containing protein [Pelagicoccus albus]|uniref:PKD domain-containing protein n=1 Tax=Pelagicoccus albus TaxID=415222 RepID=A0A7X1E7T8_9BACT|nr:PKD domain-containing protein [Pelagicoccus albus]MBC2605614.1 PKD domain-containing protein [Pelagicoccus albus]
MRNTTYILIAIALGSLALVLIPETSQDKTGPASIIEGEIRYASTQALPQDLEEIRPSSRIPAPAPFSFSNLRETAIEDCESLTAILDKSDSAIADTASNRASAQKRLAALQWLLDHDTDTAARLALTETQRAKLPSIWGSNLVESRIRQTAFINVFPIDSVKGTIVTARTDEGSLQFQPGYPIAAVSGTAEIDYIETEGKTALVSAVSELDPIEFPQSTTVQSDFGSDVAEITSAASSTSTYNKLVHVRFSDQDAYTVSDTSYIDETSAFLYETSLQKYANGVTADTAVYDLPQTADYYSYHIEELLSDVRSVYLAETGNSIESYNVITYFPASDAFTFEATASIDGSDVLLNGANTFHQLSHNLGHLLGLHHAESANYPGGVSEELGDNFDVMGNGQQSTDLFGVFSLLRRGWVTESQIGIAGEGTYRIYNSEAVEAKYSEKLGYLVQRGEGATYLVSYRAVNSPDSAYIQWVKDSETASYIDAPIVGEPFLSHNRDFKATVTDSGGAAPYNWIDVQVEAFDPIPLDTPVLTSPDTANARESVSLSVYVPNHEEEDILYTWEFDDGQTAYGSEISWVFAAGGSRTVTVTALDSSGASSSVSKTIEVSDPLSTFTSFSGFPEQANSVTFVGPVHTALTSEGAVFTSADGQQWTREGSLPQSQIYTGYLTASNGDTIAVATQNSETLSQSIVASSDGGRSWNTADLSILSAGETIAAIETSGDSFVIATNTLLDSSWAIGIYSSDNALSWTLKSTISSSEPAESLDNANGHLIVTGDNGALYASDNLTLWVDLSLQNGEGLESRGVASNGTRIIALQSDAIFQTLDSAYDWDILSHSAPVSFGDHVESFHNLWLSIGDDIAIATENLTTSLPESWGVYSEIPGSIRKTHQGRIWAYGDQYSYSSEPIETFTAPSVSLTASDTGLARTNIEASASGADSYAWKTAQGWKYGASVSLSFPIGGTKQIETYGTQGEATALATSDIEISDPLLTWNLAYEMGDTPISTASQTGSFNSATTAYVLNGAPFNPASWEGNDLGLDQIDLFKNLNGTYFAAGLVDGTPSYCYSEDGSSWTAPVAAPFAIVDIAWIEGKAFAIAADGQTMTSENLTTWTGGAIPGLSSVKAIAFDGDIAIIIGNDTWISEDSGASWTARSISGPSNCSALIPTQSGFYAIADETLRYDLTTEKWETTELPDGISDIVSLNGVYYALNPTTDELYASFEGIHWESADLPISIAFLSANGDTLLGASSDGSIYAAGEMGVPPSITSFTIGQGASSTYHASIGVDIETSGVATHYRISDSNVTSYDWIELEDISNLWLSEPFGTKTFHVQVAGDWGVSSLASTSIDFVDGPPAVETISFSEAVDSVVTTKYLSLSFATNKAIEEYLISEDPTFDGAEWLEYQSDMSFTLSEGSGLKTVYLKVRNENGVSETQSLEVTLEANPPVIDSASYSAASNQTENSIELSYQSSGYTEYQISLENDFSEALWTEMPEDGILTATFPSEDGSYYVYARLQNEHGVSDPYEIQIDLDIPDPAILTAITSPDSASSQYVKISLEVSGDPSFEFMTSTDETFSDASPADLPSDNIVIATLPGFGRHQVYVKVWNSFGSSQDSFLIDYGTAAILESFTAPSETDNEAITLTLECSGSGNIEYQASLDPDFAGEQWLSLPENGSIAFNLPSYEGEHTVYTRIRNAFGPTEALSSTCALRFPVPSIATLSGTETTASTVNTLSLEYDSRLPTEYQISLNGDFSDCEWIEMTEDGTIEFTLPEADGNYSIHTRLRNANGVSGTSVHEVTLNFPEPASLLGIAYESIASSKTVTLELELEGDPSFEYKLSYDEDFSDCEWAELPSDYIIEANLPDSGDHTLWVKLKNDYGESQALDATIRYGSPAILTSIDCEPSGYSNLVELSLEYEGTETLQYQASLSDTFENSSWLTFEGDGSLDYVLPTEIGSYEIYVRLRNGFGNTQTLSSQYELIAAPTPPPEIVSIATGETSESTDINLSLLYEGEGTIEYETSFDPNFENCSWEPLDSTDIPIELPAIAGIHTVYVRLKSEYGVSEIQSSEVELLLAPTITSWDLFDNQGMPYASGSVHYEGSGEIEYTISWNPKYLDSGWTTLSSNTISCDLPDRVGAYTIYIKLRNEIGESPLASASATVKSQEDRESSLIPPSIRHLGVLGNEQLVEITGLETNNRYILYGSSDLQEWSEIETLPVENPITRTIPISNAFLRVTCESIPD